jgi:hypothetical protein
MHAANFVAFLGLCGAYEYLLVKTLELASLTPRSALRGPWGLVVAYALFGFMALTMTPLELTTPDILAAAAVLVAFGALLRLKDAVAAAEPRTWEHAWRPAVALGAALGVGAYAKSFMVPWAFVCLVILAFAMRRRGRSLTAIAVVVWGVMVLPWCAVLSRQSGHLTFGDSGRLTYAWYVNEQDAPSLGGVPPGARTPAAEAILPGTAITGLAPGTDPMWFDPTRWNSAIEPHWSLRQQLETFNVSRRFYLQQFTPLLFLIFFIVAAPSGTRRAIWTRGWIVFLPAAAGLLAYAMVLVTARYVMPFVLVITLAVLATVPIARRISPLLALIGIAIPAVLESLDIRTAAGLGIVTAVLGAMLAGVVIPARSRVVWLLSVIFAALAAHVILTPLGADVLPFAVFGLVVLFWMLSRTALRSGGTLSFARRAEVAMAVVLFAVFALRFENRISADLTALGRAGSPTWGNVSKRIADDLASHGVTSATRIAVIGPHAEAYWARAGRLRIVADVPRPVVERFWGLAAVEQDSLLRQFAAAGATYVIASMPPSVAAPPSDGWTPVKFGGWVRMLRAP